MNHRINNYFLMNQEDSTKEKKSKPQFFDANTCFPEDERNSKVFTDEEFDYVHAIEPSYKRVYEFISYSKNNIAAWIGYLIKNKEGTTYTKLISHFINLSNLEMTDFSNDMKTVLAAEYSHRLNEVFSMKNKQPAILPQSCLNLLFQTIKIEKGKCLDKDQFKNVCETFQVPETYLEWKDACTNIKKANIIAVDSEGCRFFTKNNIHVQQISYFVKDLKIKTFIFQLEHMPQVNDDDCSFLLLEAIQNKFLIVFDGDEVSKLRARFNHTVNIKGVFDIYHEISKKLLQQSRLSYLCHDFFKVKKNVYYSSGEWSKKKLSPERITYAGFDAAILLLIIKQVYDDGWIHNKMEFKAVEEIFQQNLKKIKTGYIEKQTLEKEYSEKPSPVKPMYQEISFDKHDGENSEKGTINRNSDDGTEEKGANLRIHKLRVTLKKDVTSSKPEYMPLSEMSMLAASKYTIYDKKFIEKFPDTGTLKIGEHIVDIRTIKKQLDGFEIDDEILGKVCAALRLTVAGDNLAHIINFQNQFELEKNLGYRKDKEKRNIHHWKWCPSWYYLCTNVKGYVSEKTFPYIEYTTETHQKLKAALYTEQIYEYIDEYYFSYYARCPSLVITKSHEAIDYAINLASDEADSNDINAIISEIKTRIRRNNNSIWGKIRNRTMRKISDMFWGTMGFTNNRSLVILFLQAPIAIELFERLLKLPCTQKRIDRLITNRVAWNYGKRCNMCKSPSSEVILVK